jgi:hypothetical protein
MDLLIHSRSESPVFMEVARDERSPLRELTRCLVRALDAAGQILEDALPRKGYRVVVTTDHGSIHCNRPTTVFARKGRHVQPSVQVRATDLRAEDPGAVLHHGRTPLDLRLPPGGLRGSNYLLALEDYFMVYPTKLREYQKPATVEPSSTGGSHRGDDRSRGAS